MIGQSVEERDFPFIYQVKTKSPVSPLPQEIRSQNMCCQWIQSHNETMISFIIPDGSLALIATYHQQVLIN